MYSTLKPLYKCSRALIIGINKYQKVSPLSYAIHDAKGIYDVLVDDFKFKKENITLLIDEKANKNGIMDSFLKFANDDIENNNCVISYKPIILCVNIINLLTC